MVVYTNCIVFRNYTVAIQFVAMPSANSLLKGGCESHSEAKRRSFAQRFVEYGLFGDHFFLLHLRVRWGAIRLDALETEDVADH